ncbi:hypothetical protein LIER_04336 [Lithospermum erythrorhizon]|uniref:Uncharacterized protein n=1 Tax=Lithospermum erythrorhizon TaxID=34254 RepID=A0AAV3NXM9_LITER
MTEDIDDPVSPNSQKVTFRNFNFDFSPSLVNAFYGRANGGETGYNLQLPEIVKVLTGGDVDTWPDKGLPSSKISVKDAVLHKARKSVLEARLRSLSGADDTEDEPAVGDASTETPLA